MSLLALNLPGLAQAVTTADFNPHFIISDPELQDYNNWTSGDIQNFLDSKGSYLRQYKAPDVKGVEKSAAEIIYDSAQTYQINPKFLLVTLQKEQSLITDDTPSSRQLDWATGYAVCDSCSREDPKVAKHKGFAKQVDDAAGIMRWYYDNKERNSIILKKDVPVLIDNKQIIPQSWATAFLYTYTPHEHGNLNFWRIWNTWFEEIYPDGSLLQSASSTEMWLIRDGERHRFANQTALVTRTDPKLAIIVPDIQLQNYPVGKEINLPNYSLLRSPGRTTYLLDNDTIRPFASEAVIRTFGYNPQEIIDVSDADLANYKIGLTINAESTAPAGVIYQITDLNNKYYLLKDNLFYPLIDKKVAATNYKNIPIEKHLVKDLNAFPVADTPITFADGSLLKSNDSNTIYVIEKGKKRRIADNDTFTALGYKKENIVTVDLLALLTVPSGQSLFLNSSLLSAKNKFLGDSESAVPNSFTTKLPSYLVAEYPSGRLLAGKNIDTARPIASFTKLITAYEALNTDFKPQQTATYESKKLKQYDNKIGFKESEKIKNIDLLNALLIGSINSASGLLAQGVGLTEAGLLQRMNERLSEWGADNSSLADVSGLNSENKSTPRDLLKIFVKVLADPVLKPILQKSTYSFAGTVGKKSLPHQIKSTNDLYFSSNKKQNYTILASKTGYTDEAGSVLIMLIQVNSTKKQYVLITLGNPDYVRRFDEPSRLAEWVANGNVTVAAKK